MEEQVLNNQQQIEYLKQLKIPGLKIVGTVSQIESLPDPDTYQGDIGDCFLAGNTLPYDLYIYASYGNNVMWVYLGPFPAQGPKGTTGNKGDKGDKGDSSTWYTGTSFPASPKTGDMFLNTNTMQVYRYDYLGMGYGWQSKCNIKGAGGRDGQNGNSIQSISIIHSDVNQETTITITTTKGGTTTFAIPDGKPGAGFKVAGIYDYTGTWNLTQENAMKAEYPVADYNFNDAILVRSEDSSGPSYIYVMIEEDNVKDWDNAGEIDSIQGPPGTQIESSDQISVNDVIGQDAKQLTINAIPYQTTAPDSGTNLSNMFKIVVLYESQKASTVKRDGYLYIFIEDLTP